MKIIKEDIIERLKNSGQIPLEDSDREEKIIKEQNKVIQNYKSISYKLYIENS
ncbi:hypothetical protein ACQY1Q_05930 [Tenacibaculum sp. TC6]|uniref:hypothetical protein n=1 Tax=Tenacibaculum sp. TC6 TaxID=3423223 RepID=UPI003D36FBAE